MAIAYVAQQGSRAGGSSGSTSTITFNPSQNLGAGNMLLVAAIGGGVTVSSVTDTKGNTYHLDQSGTNGSGTTIYLYSTVQNAGTLTTTDTVTVTYSGATTHYGVASIEFSGISANSRLDQVNTALGSATNRTAGSLTTTSANELIVAVYGVDGNNDTTFTPGAGYTSLMTVQGFPLLEGEYQIVSSVGTYTTPATGDSHNTVGVSASYVAASTLSTIVGKTGTSGTAVMQKSANSWTYVAGKTGGTGTGIDQKGAGTFTKVKGH